MIAWYWVVVMAIGLTLWSVFCVLIGAGIIVNGIKNEKLKRLGDPKMN